jgi:hypothetical protein
MLAVILAEDDAFSRAVSHRSRLQKYSIIRYRDPVKLADNIPELRPDALIIRLEDFPLHWELFPFELNCLGTLQNTKIILFTPPAFVMDHDFPEGIFHILHESSSALDIGHLAPDTAKRLASLLSSSPGKVVSDDFLGSGNDIWPEKLSHVRKSRLMAAAELRTKQL